jgi:hypothetical protein
MKVTSTILTLFLGVVGFGFTASFTPISNVTPCYKTLQVASSSLLRAESEDQNHDAIDELRNKIRVTRGADKKVSRLFIFCQQIYTYIYHT